MPLPWIVSNGSTGKLLVVCPCPLITAVSSSTVKILLIVFIIRRTKCDYHLLQPRKKTNRTRLSLLPFDLEIVDRKCVNIFVAYAAFYAFKAKAVHFLRDRNCLFPKAARRFANGYFIHNRYV